MENSSSMYVWVCFWACGFIQLFVCLDANHIIFITADFVIIGDGISVGPTAFSLFSACLDDCSSFSISVWIVKSFLHKALLTFDADCVGCVDFFERNWHLTALTRVVCVYLDSFLILLALSSVAHVLLCQLCAWVFHIFDKWFLRISFCFFLKN